jgi:hypothetical protein
MKAEVKVVFTMDIHEAHDLKMFLNDIGEDVFDASETLTNLRDTLKEAII